MKKYNNFLNENNLISNIERIMLLSGLEKYEQLSDFLGFGVESAKYIRISKKLSLLVDIYDFAEMIEISVHDLLKSINIKT